MELSERVVPSPFPGGPADEGCDPAFSRYLRWRERNLPRIRLDYRRGRNYLPE
ncbi:MAG TPA: hypothetical protein VMT44_07550 [Methanoregula sp.]|nr:hypothetical protein [Methanoregula sp.]